MIICALKEAQNTRRIVPSEIFIAISTGKKNSRFERAEMPGRLSRLIAVTEETAEEMLKATKTLVSGGKNCQRISKKCSRAEEL